MTFRTASGALERRRRAPLWWVLLRHEWRLTARDFFGAGRTARSGKPTKVVGTRRRVAVYAVAAVLLHSLGLVTLAAPRRWVDLPETRIAAVVVVGFLFTIMLSAAMTRVVAAFHERRDLDLLLGAPVAATTILSTRAATVAIAVTALFGAFVFPIANVGVATGHWWMARLYALLPVMAIGATGVALASTGLVVRVVGVRRARVGLQVVSALVGASFYLVSQARHLVPQHWSAAVATWLRDAASADPLPWPVAFASGLASGDRGAWSICVSVSLAVFALAAHGVRKRFVEVAQTPEADSRVVTAPRGLVDRRIADGFARRPFATLLVKEWRLVLRSPQLISQVLLQLLYLMPLLFVAYGRDATAAWAPAAFAAGLVGVASTLATSLAWLTVAAEDAPDLLAGSPKPRGELLAAKLTAATVPPVVLVAVAAIGTARYAPGVAWTVLAFGVASCLAAAVLAAASSSTGRRTDFQRRHHGNLTTALLEGLQFLLWGAAAGAAVSDYRIAAAIVTVVALSIPVAALPRALRSFAPATR